MVMSVSPNSIESPSVGTPAARACASHRAQFSPCPSGPVRSWLPEETATRLAASSKSK